MRAHRDPVKHVRRLFIRGKLRPVRESKPCGGQWHAGPLLDTSRFDPAGGMWSGMGTCAACSSTVHHTQIRRLA